MTPERFIAKWRSAELTERAAAQSHFLDLCELLDEPKPTDADPRGEWYCFERGATKTTGGEGWADVWKRGCFGWEYKGKRKSLDDALDQLKRYALALENPPLLVVSDLDRVRIVTNWTNTVSYRHEIALEDLRDPRARQKLKWVFSEPERLRPGLTRQAVTEIAARKFAELARDLRAAGHPPEDVAHFVNRLVFCLFAEDVGLLPNQMLKRMLDAARAEPGEWGALSRTLFAAMRAGGRLGLERVAWFNGGLFDDDATLPLSQGQIERVLDAAEMDWSEIDPSIMGTLFERGLDPDKRSQLGAHYTDRDKIMKIVEPVIQRPLEAEWAEAKARIEAALGKAEAARSPAARTRLLNEAGSHYRGFLDRLRGFKVLDPACGSGNFLYLALHTLKDLELRAGIEAEALGLPREFPRVGPEQLLGIEINPYAAELARVSVWIGEIQWMLRHGFAVSGNPVLRPLDTIACRDALIDSDGRAAVWPKADAIIGNPPFLGTKLMNGSLGRDYAETIRRAYPKLSRFSDLVCFWFEKANEQLRSGKVQRVGLVSTNSIRGGRNRDVLDRLLTDNVIFEAWSDEPWIIDGANVRVSLICLQPSALGSATPRLDGREVARINADLTPGVSITAAKIQRENAGTAFNGIQKSGPFEIPGELARRWLSAPVNANGRPNADVLFPFWNGLDLVRRSQDRWVIDFGCCATEDEACFYELPWAHAVETIKPAREAAAKKHSSAATAAAMTADWWRFWRPRPEMRRRLRQLSRYAVTNEVAKHRLFAWLPPQVVPDKQLIVIAKEDDVTLGILHSRAHELWSLRLGTSLEDRPRYTPSTTFETFPFPEGLTPDIPASAHAADPRARRVADAAKRLHELRESWLNPSDLVVRVPEVAPGYPDRLLPKDEAAAKELKKRTLTNLYNQRPAWLVNLHRELDEAVAAAYGWPAGLADEEVLRRLLALNLERAAAGR